MDILGMTIESGVAQGLMWAILTIGVYITYRVLDVADLTLEGSFPLGAAIAAVSINAGVPWYLAMLLAFLAGTLAGLCTGILNTVFKIPPILAGILSMIALYSINLRITEDKITVPFANDTLKRVLMNKFGDLGIGFSTVNFLEIATGLVFCVAIIVLLYVFFGTEIGCAIRATGSNSNMARALGVNTNIMTVIGLMISNGLISLAGSLIAQFDLGSAILTMGQGAIVIGLASVIIGEVVFIRKDHSFAYKLFAVTMGAVIYRSIIALILKYNSIATIIDSFGYEVISDNVILNWTIKSTDLKLITAIVVSIALALPVLKGRIAAAKLRRQNNKAVLENEGGAADA